MQSEQVLEGQNQRKQSKEANHSLREHQKSDIGPGKKAGRPDTAYQEKLANSDREDSSGVGETNQGTQKSWEKQSYRKSKIKHPLSGQIASDRADM